MSIHIPSEQIKYAKVLNICVIGGFFTLIGGLFFYIKALFEQPEKAESIKKMWSLPVTDYVAKNGSESVWFWTANWESSEFWVFGSITFFLITTIICYLTIVPELAKKKDYVYISLAVGEILVLIIAASGLLMWEGH